MTLRSFFYVLIFSLHPMSALSIARSNDNFNAFKEAIILKDVGSVNYLLNSGIVPDDQTIMFAMDNGLPGMVILSLVKKANFKLDRTFSNGMSLKKYSLIESPYNKSLLVYLVQNGISFHHDAESINYFSYDAHSSKKINHTLELVRVFLENGYTSDFILKSSCFLQNLRGLDLGNQVFDLLFQFGLDPNISLKFGHGVSVSLLCFGTYQGIVDGNINLIEKLIAWGASVNQTSFVGDFGPIGLGFSYEDAFAKKITPLVFALLWRKSLAPRSCPAIDKVIEILIKNGAVL